MNLAKLDLLLSGFIAGLVIGFVIGAILSRRS